MKKKYLIFFASILFLYGNATSQTPEWVWAKGMQDPSGWDGGTGYAMVRDTFGNIYTTGAFDGTFDFDPGPGVFLLTGGGAFITKLDSSGNFIWAISMTGTCIARSIALDDSGNIYVGGSILGAVDFDPGPGTYILSSSGLSDICFAKFDSAGNYIWARVIGGAEYDGCTSIIVDEYGSGDIIIAGSFGYSTIDFDPGPGTFYLTSVGNYCHFVARFNGSGNFVWAKAAGGYNSWITSMALDPTGNGDIYFAGGFNFTVDFDMGPGVFNLTSVGANPVFSTSDIFICKLDSMGNFIWAKAMGGPGWDNAHSLGLNSSGDVYTTGYFNDIADFDPGAGTFNFISQGGDDIFISKLDNSGNFVWAKAIGGIDFDAVTSLALDPSGSEDFYITGTFVDTVDFDPGAGVANLTSDIFGDIFVVRYDSAGSYIWGKTAVSNSVEFSNFIIIDPSENVYITGSFLSDTCFFGPITLLNTGANNKIFIARLDAETETGINEVSSHSLMTSIFPNPFSGSTTISLTLNRSENISLKIIDVNGRLITNLADHVFEAGAHEIIWDAENVNAGIYFLQIQSAENLQIQKIILTK